MTLALMQFTLSGLVPILVALLVFAIIVYVVHLVLGMLSLPPQVRMIALLILGVVFLIYLFQMLGLI